MPTQWALSPLAITIGIVSLYSDCYCIYVSGFNRWTRIHPLLGHTASICCFSDPFHSIKYNIKQNKGITLYESNSLREIVL